MKTNIDAANALDCWTDEELLKEFRLTGNREHFEILVHRYEKSLFSFLYGKMGNRESAEDVFQATFLQVYLKCDQFEDGRSFRPWLYCIAGNKAIDHRRRNKRHDAVSLDETCVGVETSGDSLQMFLESDEVNPADAIQTKDDVAKLRRKIQALPATYQSVIDLVCLRGMTYREAAQELGIKPKTVATRLTAAKRSLAVGFDC